MNQGSNYTQILETILQEELFSSLAGENPDSARLSYLYEVVNCLQGTYKDEGVRRWFQRKRAQLAGNSPLEYLGSQWKPEDEKAQEVLKLARSLLG